MKSCVEINQGRCKFCTHPIVIFPNGVATHTELFRHQNVNREDYCPCEKASQE